MICLFFLFTSICFWHDPWAIDLGVTLTSKVITGVGPHKVSMPTTLYSSCVFFNKLSMQWQLQTHFWWYISCTLLPQYIYHNLIIFQITTSPSNTVVCSCTNWVTGTGGITHQVFQYLARGCILSSTQGYIWYGTWDINRSYILCETDSYMRIYT